MIRFLMLFARAQMMEEPRNIAIAIRIISFRPHISENLDHRGAPAAFASR